MKKKITSPIALLLAASVLANSCSGNYFIEQEESVEHFAVSDVAKEFLPVDIIIDDATFEYLDNISKMFRALYTSKTFRNLLQESPDVFFAQYNLPEKVDIENSEFKLLFALTDEDILSSLKKDDVKTFLTLCRERGYFTNLELSQEVLKLKQLLDENPDLRDNITEISQRADTAVAAVVAAVYVLVLYNVGVGINWAAGVIAWLEVIATSTSAKNLMIKSITQDENILRIWINKDSSIQKKLIEEYAKQITDIGNL